MTRRVTLFFLLSSLIIFVFADFIVLFKGDLFKNALGVVKKYNQNEESDNEEDEGNAFSEKKLIETESLYNHSYLYTFFHTQLLVSCEISTAEKLQIIHFDIESPPPEAPITFFF